MFNNGIILNCKFTTQDVHNAASILGPCLACIAGKLRAKPIGTSDSSPATIVGGQIHMDIIPMSVPTIGGNTVYI